MNEIQFKSSYRCWYIFKKIQIPWYTKKNDKNDPKSMTHHDMYTGVCWNIWRLSQRAPVMPWNDRSRSFSRRSFACYSATRYCITCNMLCFQISQMRKTKRAINFDGKKNSSFFALFNQFRFVAAIKRKEMRGRSKRTISFICQLILATF